jgi:predicted nucleotidyltransferase
MHRPKDFIQTAEGLLFAVVAANTEAGKIRCFLRYAPVDGCYRKVASAEANQFLAAHHPQYLFFSTQLDVNLHAVAEKDIVRHYQPQPVLQQLLANDSAADQVLADLHLLCRYLQLDGFDCRQLGITGSLLLGLQNPASDIDLVCYGRAVFQQLRRHVQALIAQSKCHDLNDHDWLEAYKRRDCALTLDDYIWHEQRKYNKAIIQQRKFDLSLVVGTPLINPQASKKLGFIHIETQVKDDTLGFDYPAELAIKHPEISSIICFTATYAGQAQTGEWIEVAGQLEVDAAGIKRIVVGSNREAAGEFIKVLR